MEIKPYRTKLIAVFIIVGVMLIGGLAFMPQSDDSTALTDGNWEYVVNDDGLTATLTRFTGTGVSSLTLPLSVTDGVNTYDVVAIRGQSEDQSAIDYSALTDSCTLTIPNGIVTIGDYAFCESPNEEYGHFSGALVIPNSVTSIGVHAFSRCYYFISVTLSTSLESIGDYAFQYDSGFADSPLILRNCNNLTYIGNHAFDSCTFIGNLIFPNTPLYIGNYAFYGCLFESDGSGVPGSYTELNLGTSVELIGEYAFYDCMFKRNLVIPNSVRDIGKYAFSGVPFDGTLTLSGSLTFIQDSVFEGCLFTGTLTIPDSVTTIGKMAFRDCRFTGIDLGNVREIGEESFEGCIELTGNLTIPDSVVVIDRYAFSGCKKITGITFPEVAPTGFRINEGAFDLCLGLTGELRLPYGLTSIPKNTFRQYAGGGFSSVIIPETVMVIGDSAFYENSNLKTVFNASQINITIGSTDNGYVGYYADNIYSAYTVTFESNNDGYGYVTQSILTIARPVSPLGYYVITWSGNELYIGSYTITAIPYLTDDATIYVFDHWDVTSPYQVNRDMTITAVFTSDTGEIIQLDIGESWTATPTSDIPDATFSISGNATSWLTMDDNIISGTAPNVDTLTVYQLFITAVGGGQTEVQRLVFAVVPPITATVSPDTLYVWSGGPIPNTISETLTFSYVGFGTGTYVWSVVDDNGTGVNITADGHLTGTAGNVTYGPVTVTVRITGTVSSITQTADVDFDVVVVAKLVFTSNPFTDAIIT